jgi:8-hydroxy-5-deazaflavin:NADPH oxidoreductase
VKIATVGRGNVGGGLAKLWRAAGHDVTEVGRDGGDVSAAEVVLLAVPEAAIADAIAAARGIAGRTVIDATNHWSGERDPAFQSLAAQVKSLTGGPVAKAFNLNFATLYDRRGAARRPPTNLFAGDDEARAAVEQLSRDAGYEPVSAGPLENARVLEDSIRLLSAIGQAGLGQFVYRFAAPEDL